MIDGNTLLENVAKDLNTTVAEAGRLTKALAEVIAQCGEELDSVSIPRFGNFDTVKADERVDIDRSTGRRVLLPPCISITFQASANLRKSVRNSKKGGAR